jgi:hypothetical protein
MRCLYGLAKNDPIRTKRGLALLLAYAEQKAEQRRLGLGDIDYRLLKLERYGG